MPIRRGVDRIPRPGETIRRPLTDDIRGIRKEIERMVLTVRDSVADPLVLATIRTILSPLSAKDKLSEMAMIFAWVKEHTRYINDPPDKEVLTTPNRMIRDANRPVEVLESILGPYLSKVVTGDIDLNQVPSDQRRLYQIGLNVRSQEDCDGIALFSATLLGASGIVPRFVFGGQPEPDGQCMPMHVWVQGLAKEGWVNMDLAEPDQPLNWYYKGFGCYSIQEIFTPDEVSA